VKITEIRERDTADLGEEVLKLRREAFRLRMQSATGQSVPTSRVREIRLSIARIKTGIGERRRATGSTGGGEEA